MKFPKDAFTISDNDEAMSVLISEGLLGKFPERSGFTKSGMRAICYTGHVTHWLLAIEFFGHVKPDDNGYVIYGFSKSKFPENILDQQIHAVTERHGDGSGIRVTSIKPNNN